MNRLLCVPVVHALLLTAPIVCADDFPNVDQLRGPQSTTSVSQNVAPFDAAPVEPPLNEAAGAVMLPEAVIRTPDQIPLGPRPATSRDADGKTNGSASASGLSAGSIIGSLAFVIVLILGLAKVVVRKSPYAVPGVPQAAIDVLGRRTIDPRHSVYVVQVGSKILLLGSSAGGMTTLSEITDPIEVASLSNICRAEQSSRAEMPGWLAGLFGRREKPADGRPFTERFGGRLAQDTTTPSVAPAPQTESRRVA